MKEKLEPIEGRIDVWSIYLPDHVGEQAACRALLTPGEQNRAARFLRPADAAGFVITRGLLRRILSSYLDQPAAAICFERNGNGKPFLEGRPLEFNLSHSRDRALIAVTAGRRVGIDIEFRRHDLHIEDIVARWFAPAEQAAVRGAMGSPANSFFDIWARKEAYVKAMGISIYRDFNTFAVPPESGPNVPATGNDAGWFFQTLAIAPDYAAALVAETPAVPVCLRCLTE